LIKPLINFQSFKQTDQKQMRMAKIKVVAHKDPTAAQPNFNRVSIVDIKQNDYFLTNNEFPWTTYAELLAKELHSE